MRLYLILALVAAAIAGTGLYTWRVYDAGQKTGGQEAAERITGDMINAADKAHDARERVRACYRSGGVWDRAKGQCRFADLPGAR